MAHSLDTGHALGEKPAQRKLLDQRRMHYRRAIERYSENRRLQSDIASYTTAVDGETRRPH
jgi:hypothetical protein